MKTKQAAVLTTARTKNESHLRAYRNCYTPSREKLKEQIGRLLLYLQRPLNQNRQKQLLQLFESNLRQYYAVKLPYRILQNVSGERFSGTESTNAEQEVI